MRDIWRTVRRIHILMLGLIGFMVSVSLFLVPVGGVPSLPMMLHEMGDLRLAMTALLRLQAQS